MTRVDDGPTATPAYRRLPITESPNAAGTTARRRRHTLAAALVAGYLAAAAVLVPAHRLVAVPGWLALHLLVLGAASNAVFVYTRHFAQALLHARPTGEWPAHVRLALLNAGAVAVLAGVSAQLRWLAVAGAALVVGAVLAHTAGLVGMARGAHLAGRLRDAVRYYVAAGTALAVGGTLGGLLAGDAVRSGRWVQAIRLTHAHLNLLGWLGLAVLGTQFMLWPAVLRTRMVDTAPRVARRVLVISVTGLAVAAGGLVLTGSLPSAHWLAAAGMAGYAAGVAYSAAPAIREMRATPPRGAAPVALLAGNGWLLVALIADIVGLAIGDSTADALLGRLLVPALGIGVIGQILTGALTFLLPVTVGGGPAGNRRMTAVLEYAWLPRAVLGNLGALLVLLPFTADLRTLCWALVLIGFGSFPVLVVAALVTGHRGTTGEPAPRWRLAGHEVLAVGAVATVLAVLALVGSGTWPGQRESHPGGTAVTATSGIPVAVTLDEFMITPATITVPPGTDLVLAVRNSGQQSHDLRLDGQHGTGMLAPGRQQTVDLGAVTHDEQAWCTVPGHRAAGMSLTIRLTTSPAWRPYDPTLRPAPGGTEHDVTLRVEQTTVEVAPGVRQQVWTYNGTVPGPVLHGRVGDLFTVRVINDGDLPHSIDFHASQVDPATAMRAIPPGGRLTYQFRAEHAGIWLYHCGTAPMIEHVAMGMYGAVVVDPADLAPARTSDVFVQSEFYLGPNGGMPAMSQLLAADPDLVVFNGYADQYRSAPIHVRVGQRIRLWVLDAGPNGPTAFHVVGAQFDTVFKEGGYQLLPGAAAGGAASELDLQPGEGGFVELTIDRPGSYPFTTHRLADAERGAMGTIVADP